MKEILAYILEHKDVFSIFGTIFTAVMGFATALAGKHRTLTVRFLGLPTYEPKDENPSEPEPSPLVRFHRFSVKCAKICAWIGAIIGIIVFLREPGGDVDTATKISYGVIYGGLYGFAGGYFLPWYCALYVIALVLGSLGYK